MRNRKQFAPLAVVAVAAVALSACGSSGSSNSGAAPSQSGFQSSIPSQAAAASLGNVAQLTIGQEQAPTNFNNNQLDANSAELAIIEEAVLPAAYRGQLNVTYGWDKNLLASEPVVTAPTATTPQIVKYVINPNAVWSDGVPITAEDFKYNWISQNGSGKYQSAVAGAGYSNIESVTGGTGKDVTVTFKKGEPYVDYQGLFTEPMLPAHLFEAGGADAFNTGMTKGIEINGTKFSGGPYIEDSYTPNQSLTLVPNPKWWGAKPKVQKLVFRFIEDTTQFPDALQNGELDIVNPQPTADEVTKTKAVTRLSTSIYPQLTFEHIDYNFKNKFLSDPAVRKAISTAVDVKSVIAGTVGQFAPDTVPLGNRLLLNNQAGYVDHSGTYGKGDAAGADKLLTADGYTKSGQYYSKPGLGTLEVSITCKNGNPLRQSEEQIMQAQLAKAGIKLDIKNTDKGIGEFTSAHAYDIALFAWVGNPALSSNDAIYQTAPAAGSSNTQFLSDPKIDALIKSADGEFDNTKRIADYNQVDQLLWDDAATLPLFQKAGFLAYPSTIANIQDNPTQDGFTYNVQDWGMKTS